MDYRFDCELIDDNRVEELSANLAQGNNNSAKSWPMYLKTKIIKEVNFEFALPIWFSAVTKMPKAIVNACGLVTQWTFLETGERKDKSCLTHNLSCCITNSYSSVNRWLNKKACPYLIDGFYLLMIINFIVALRLCFKEIPVLVNKNDFLEDYQRISHWVTLVIKTIIMLGIKAYFLALLVLRGICQSPSLVWFQWDTLWFIKRNSPN